MGSRNVSLRAVAAARENRFEHFTSWGLAAAGVGYLVAALLTDAGRFRTVFAMVGVGLIIAAGGFGAGRAIARWLVPVGLGFAAVASAVPVAQAMQNEIGLFTLGHALMLIATAGGTVASNFWISRGHGGILGRRGLASSMSLGVAALAWYTLLETIDGNWTYLPSNILSLGGFAAAVWGIHSSPNRGR